MAQGLPQRTGSLHGNEVSKVLHVGALVFVIEEVISRCERNHVLAGSAECHLGESHVEVRAVISSDDKVCVGRNIGLAFVMRAQKRS